MRVPIPAMATRMMPNSAICIAPPRSPDDVGSRPHPGLGIALMHSLTSRSRSMKSFVTGGAGGGVVADAFDATAPSGATDTIAHTRIRRTHVTHPW